MSFDERLKRIITRHNCLREQLENYNNISSADMAKLSKEYSDIADICDHADKYFQNMELLCEADTILANLNQEEELLRLAQEQKICAQHELIELKKQLSIMLIPKDVADDKAAILEIRAGTGGDEAALFVAVLFKMYKIYAEKAGWKIEMLSSSDSVLDGYKEIIMSVMGKGVYKRLKYESGVHRVQRVPETESLGRVHTSTATVAILPEAEDIDIKINDADIRIDVYRSSGAGGQHVNTTDSAVRITHLPTGISVTQSEKSQHQNKAKAMKILKSRLYEIERNKQEQQTASMRKEQMGSGDRSEKIRTYNYPQNRITDHRINFTTYDLAAVVEGGKLDVFIDALIADDNLKKLGNQDDFQK